MLTHVKRLMLTAVRLKIQFIRRFPLAASVIAWLQGIIIGILIYHYLFQVRYSCCVELG